jgi:hypothetical protein
MLEVIILLATLRLCHAPFNIGADTMEDALEMPAASTITAMAFAATALALGRKRLLSTSVSTPPPVPLRLFRRTVDSSALPADPADPKSGYDLPSPASASGAGGPSFDIDSDAEECEDYDESAADDSDDDGGQTIIVDPRPAPQGPQRTLDDWRQEAAVRRAESVTTPGQWSLDRSPTGAGKSFATNQALQLVSSSLTVLPTHTLCREQVEALRADGVEVREVVMTFDDVTAADEVFLSGNFSKVMPVTAFEDRQYRVGPVTRRVRDLYWDWARSAA